MLKSLFFVSLLLYMTISLPAQSGLIFDDAAYERIPIIDPDASRSILLQLPPQASLKAYCPAAGNQAYTQTCVGWAVGYVARTILYAKSQNYTNTDSITKRAFSPDFVYRNVCQAATCDTGICFSPALEVLKDKGIVFKTKLSTCARRIPDSLFSQARSYQIEDFRRLFELKADKDFKINALKRSLSEGNPVVIGAYLPLSFTNLQRNKDNWSPTEALETYLNRDLYGHAVCIVGYDDTKFGGAFEIQNSYGENWGTKGFCWVKYKDLAMCTMYAFELINNIRPIGEMPQDNLEGEIQLVFPNDTEMKVVYQTSGIYQTQNSYGQDTQFKIVLNNYKPAYIYALGTDATYQMTVLFPYHTNISAAFTYKSNQVSFPANAYFTLDEQKGKDIFCMLYSKIPLDIKKISKDMESIKGTFKDRLQQVIGDQLITQQHVQYKQRQIGFKADLHGKAIVPIMVEIEHR